MSTPAVSHTSILLSFAVTSIPVRTELVEADKQNWFVDLEAEDLWLNEVERLAVDLNEALAAVSTR